MWVNELEDYDFDHDVNYEVLGQPAPNLNERNFDIVYFKLNELISQFNDIENRVHQMEMDLDVIKGDVRENNNRVFEGDSVREAKKLLKKIEKESDTLDDKRHRVIQSVAEKHQELKKMFEEYSSDLKRVVYKIFRGLGDVKY